MTPSQSIVWKDGEREREEGFDLHPSFVYKHTGESALVAMETLPHFN